MQSFSKLTLAALAALVAACGQSHESSTTAGLPAPQAVTSATVEAGEYLVTFAKQLPCSTAELNLGKELRLNLAADQLPEILVTATGAVGDNLFHTQQCLLDPTPSRGTLRIAATDATKIEAQGDLTIVGIRKITETHVVALEAADALPAGDYVVDLSGIAACRDTEINVAKSLFYPQDGLVEAQLASAGPVRDDLIRAQVCRFPSKSFATAALHLSTESRLVTTGDLALTVTGVRAVVATEALPLR
jgi:hypothetical protein